MTIILSGIMLIKNYFKIMRTQIIKNDKLKEILTERGHIFKEIGVINEQLMELDKERTKLGYKMDKLKNKTQDIMNKEKIEVSPYEIITRIYLNDKHENEVEILDKLEEYKKALDEEIEKSKQPEQVVEVIEPVEEAKED